jgi:hypothetical protein
MLNVNRRLTIENPATSLIPAPAEYQEVVALDSPQAPAAETASSFWSGNAPYYVAGALLLFAVLKHKR